MTITVRQINNSNVDKKKETADYVQISRASPRLVFSVEASIVFLFVKF